MLPLVDDGELPTLTFATAVTVTYNSDTAAVTEAAIIAAADTAITTSINAVRIIADDSDTKISDIHYLAFDTNDDKVTRWSGRLINHTTRTSTVAANL